MEKILKSYQVCQAAIKEEDFAKAVSEMAILDKTLREFFSTNSETISKEQFNSLQEIHQFLEAQTIALQQVKSEVEQELNAFSKGKQMKKAYNQV
ncbi:hypothetical protein HII17_15140 [Thalassotalea sp. M1531]|uniref:Flagellar protein FliT n=1 Tax=Thalassotalea algicola TaxID=2716224 RepID=A0A7Y0LEE3_9GAMM|nr:hypothetical protein [Thalassotalea algicola]NMP32891.1 hypothetical protein [Thalassotalea algicola]